MIGAFITEQVCHVLGRPFRAGFPYSMAVVNRQIRTLTVAALQQRGPGRSLMPALTTSTTVDELVAAAAICDVGSALPSAASADRGRVVMTHPGRRRCCRLPGGVQFGTARQVAHPAGTGLVPADSTTSLRVTAIQVVEAWSC